MLATLDPGFPAFQNQQRSRNGTADSVSIRQGMAGLKMLSSGSLTTAPSKISQIPVEILSKIISYLDWPSHLNARKVCRIWRQAAGRTRVLHFPTAFFLPIEVIQLILEFIPTPTGFNNARKTCQAWYYSSLRLVLLREQLSKMGFTRKDPLLRNSRDVFHLSRRLSRECSLGSDGSGVCCMRLNAQLDLSEVSMSPNVQLTVSICGKYTMLLEGCVVYVYRLDPGYSTLMEFASSVLCPRKVIAVSMDTSNNRYSLAILMEGRMGLVHDIIEHQTKSVYKNLCSEEDMPRSVAICPQRRCVAFGCSGGIDLYWVDALTGRDLNRWFPLVSPSDYLFFLPPRKGVDSSKKLRLISSSAHPQEATPKAKRFGARRESGSAQNDHYQAVPLSDGYHMMFTDPESGCLCVGTDAPLGGPTKLLRHIWLVPPQPVPGLTDAEATESDSDDLDEWMQKQELEASSCLVLYSIPPDIFNGVMQEDDKATNNYQIFSSTLGHTWLGGFSPVGARCIQGSLVDHVPGLVDLAIDSGPAMAIYAFASDGMVKVYQLDGTFANEEPMEVRALHHGERELLDGAYPEEPCHQVASMKCWPETLLTKQRSSIWNGDYCEIETVVGDEWSNDLVTEPPAPNAIFDCTPYMDYQGIKG
ncbi:hypothetical protein EX30DRAFT_338004 [Ascodesmis nigricans]|uniref:F-box domain-containing protein n=1 Tax=Ascodesmis nigricans TaxID=341454 RepID=A0A4S2N8Y5_9PEZI|nr:hypothetical protein EX30DRAFT_338004 [Ascodesmis nigricans]